MVNTKFGFVFLLMQEVSLPDLQRIAKGFAFEVNTVCIKGDDTQPPSELRAVSSTLIVGRHGTLSSTPLPIVGNP